ncbi:hypothetical protein HCB49_10455 [Listeria sp. FSL L7-0123]|uniref:Uncharacterized protein n=1 Tax=Listeria cossartiae subsp. cayugensis TaxID=2713505 RepID=A0A7X0ZDF0_9LIST|nr:hypothetical protein [Listeria cossartiae]MBC2250410.1 hypothetical protein [Listeria cossartiae subsp. cayugensis]
MKIKISFKEANHLLDIRDERAKETDTLRGLQLFILALFCGFMALLPLKNSIVITSILILIIVISYIYYCTLKSSNKLLEDFGWQLAKYIMLQTITVSLILGIRVNGDRPFGDFYILVALCYLFLIAVFSYFRCKAMILNYLKSNNINLKKSASIKIWDKGFSKLLIGMLVMIILGTQIYRLSKWWFIGDDSSLSVISIQNEWLGALVVLAGGIFLLLLLIIFSLLPTLAFNPKIITNGILLKKYATEFQQENARSNQ